MKSRRSFLLTVVAGLTAAVVVAVPVLAEELVGRITKINASDKEIVVTEKDSDKETKIKVNDETIYVSGKGEESKVDLEKLSKRLERAKNGIGVTVTHEKGVASKIKAAPRKKAAP